MHRTFIRLGWLLVGLFGAFGCDSAAGDVSGTGGSNSTSTGTTTTATCGSGDTSEPIVNGGCQPKAIVSSTVMSGPYDTKTYCLGNREYYLQVNEWNSTATQTLAVGGNFFFKVTKQEASVATNGGPSGYPSMFIGANDNRVTRGSGLPKAVTAISSVPTTWNWADNGAVDSGNNIYNAAYDVWFSVNAGGDPTERNPSGGFLMVWLHKPSGAQPIGSVQYPGVTISGIPGTWDVWVGTNQGARVPCISYVRKEDPAYSMSFDLNLFIQDAVKKRPNTITDKMYLTNIFAGFEIWKGGVGLQTTGFCAGVNSL